MVNDKRQHKRYWVKGLKGRLREPYFLGLLSKPTNEEYPCLDISESGLQFASRKSFNPNDKVLLDIMTPLTKDTPIRVKSVIAWSKRSIPLGLFLVGAKFITIPKPDRTELKILIERGGQDGAHISTHVRIKTALAARLK
ncbi:MAG: PilZ domain-containing protein [Planctomycetota bacterium]